MFDLDGGWLAVLLAAMCFALTAGGCRLAARLGLFPNPVTARSAHDAPVSRAGGVVLCLVFGAVALGAAAAGLLAPTSLNLLVLVLCAGVLGAVDDAADLPALLKLFGLAVLSVLTGIAAGPVASVPIPFVGWLALPEVVGVALSVGTVLVFVNVFNFMDGLNGMAATTGAILLAGGAVMAASLGQAGHHLLLTCLAAGLFGFAWPNIRRGRPFLGDAGSLALGTAIAGGALALGGAGSLGPELSGAPFWLLAAGAVPFVADAGVTLLQRSAAGEPLMQAHADHAYQRLRRAGYGHQAVSLAYGAIAAVVTALAVAFGTGLIPGGFAPGAAWLLALLALTAWAAATRLLFARAGGASLGHDALATDANANASSVSRSGLGGSAPSDRAAEPA